MNRTASIFKRLICGIALFIPLFANSQSATDTVPYCCNFENQRELAFWRFANTSTSNGSRWMIGNATQTGVGVYSLYITNDGISNAYTNVASYSYAYRRIYIPQGIYDVSYNWASQGYVSGSTAYAYIRAFLIPATTTFTAGSALSGLSQTTLPNGAIAIDGGIGLYGRNSWQTFSNPLVQVPTTQDYYLVFYWYNNTSTATQPPGAIDNICIEPVSCPQPINITKTNLGGGCVEIDWTDFGNPQPTGWIVEYGQYGFTAGTGTKRYVTSKPDTICGLMEDMTYDFMVRAICPNGDTSKNSERIHVRYCSQLQGCIDFTNLTGPNCVCTYGLASNTEGTGQYNNGWGEYSSSNHTGPYSTRGVVNNGPRAYGYPTSQQASRHTVHTDPSIMDSLSNRQLPTIPPTGCASVRLGCAYGSYFCQAITYTMRVDTNNADIILLNYALVVYNPGHPANQQPRFTMQIVDSTDTPIDPVCGSADFNATNAANDHDQPGSPWHSGLGSGVYYRDWTPVGIDVSRYHGQTIKMRFATFNCGQGGSNHFLYAYYTLGCSKARIIANTCGNNAQVATLTAPAGFNYRWYNPSLPGWTSNQQTVQVSIDSSVYYCEVSFIDNPTCRFTMSTMAAPRFPHARFSATLDTTGCNYTVNVTNSSYASISATDPNPIGPCESFYWDWGDGSPITRSEHPGSHNYRSPGTYTIRLVVGLAGDECSDTIYQTVTFNAPEAPTISGDSVVCINTRAHIQVNGATARRWQWSNGQSGNAIDIYPNDSITMTVHVWDQLGCETVLSFHVDVDTVPLPIFDPQIYESCVPYTMSIVDINPESQRNTYSWNWGDGSTTPNNNAPTHTYSSEGNFRFTCFIKSAEGCLDTVYNTAYVFGFPHGSFSWTPPIITVTNPEIQFINLTTPNPTNVYDWEVFYHTSNPVSYPNTFEPTHRWNGSTTEYSGSNLVRLITTNQVQTPSGNVVACLDTVENTVLIINDLLQFPNTITPNGDGINDIFEIKNLIEGGGFTDNELYIYNHWGRKVYHKKNITTREDFWDPTLNNDPDGTYYYRFSAKGYLGDIMRNGVIQVTR